MNHSLFRKHRCVAICGKHLRPVVAFLVAVFMVFSLAGCNGQAPATHDESVEPDSVAEENRGINAGAEGSADETWAIYWYLCGSDLETDGGYASNDLIEMTNVTLPENVTVVIQTGGSLQWQNDIVDADAMSRLEYNEGGLFAVETVENASMGEADTLVSFLEFCETNYPADNKMLLFWDHGGGSGSGVCYDELFDNDYLTLPEIGDAFNAVYGETGDEKPLEMIGFDTCLMATVDAAALCSGYANYMTASEETEPGCGWKYDGWIGALAEAPGMDGAGLGQAICATYYEGCVEIGQESEATLSTIDLSKIGPVVNALNDLSYEAIVTMSESGSTEFFAEFARGAQRVGYYGAQGEYNSGMVDIVSWISQTAELFPDTAEQVIQSVENCVVYRINGDYCAGAYGLAAYYPHNQDMDELQVYADGSASAMAYLYEFLYYGEYSDSAHTFFAAYETEEVDGEYDPAAEHEFADVAAYGLEDWPLGVVDDGEWTYAELDIGAESSSALQSVAFTMIAFFDDGTIAYIGEDSNVEADWENGVFNDMFVGTWGAIDGHLVTTMVSSVTDDYVLYDVPILLNDELCMLTVAYTPDDGEYQILTATPDTEDGIPSKTEYLLQPGDVVTPVFYMDSTEGDSGGLYEGETFTVTEETLYEETVLPDGMYAMAFIMTDYSGTEYLSELVSVQITDGFPVISAVE